MDAATGAIVDSMLAFTFCGCCAADEVIRGFVVAGLVEDLSNCGCWRMDFCVYLLLCRNSGVCGRRIGETLLNFRLLAHGLFLVYVCVFILDGLVWPSQMRCLAEPRVTMRSLEASFCNKIMSCGDQFCCVVVCFQRALIKELLRCATTASRCGSCRNECTKVDAY